MCHLGSNLEYSGNILSFDVNSFELFFNDGADAEVQSNDGNEHPNP